MRFDASDSFETQSVQLGTYDSFSFVFSCLLIFIPFCVVFYVRTPYTERQKRLETWMKLYCCLRQFPGRHKYKWNKRKSEIKQVLGWKFSSLAWDIKTFISIQIASPVRRVQKQTYIELIVQLISKFLSSGSFRFTATSLLPAASTPPQLESFFIVVCVSPFSAALWINNLGG